MQLNLARTIARSRANGPGERFVIWVQGCSLSCPGCWNPDTWSAKPRRLIEVDAVFREVLETQNIEGITLTGGEPFQQAAALAELARQVRAQGLSVVVFTGYRLAELKSPQQTALLDCCDLLISGRYLHDRRIEGDGMRGSDNQTVHFLTSRFRQLSSSDVLCEIHLDSQGGLRVTGFPPAEIRALIDSGSTRHTSDS